MQPLTDLMNGADLGATQIAERVDWEFQANWKMSNDNWENYHHMWAHYPIYTKVTDDLDMKTRKPWSVSTQQGAVMSLKRDSKKAPPYPKRESNLPMIPFPDGAERVTAPNLVLPNVEITVVRDNIGSVIVEPLAPDRSGRAYGVLLRRRCRNRSRVRGWPQAELRPLARRVAFTGRSRRPAQSGHANLGVAADRPALARGRRGRVLPSLGGERSLFSEPAARLPDRVGMPGRA